MATVRLEFGTKLSSSFALTGNTVGEAISHHPDIRKISFTGSTLTGRKIQEASAKSNLKVVSLELGGKSPSIIFDDADLEQTIKWASMGILWVPFSSVTGPAIRTDIVSALVWIWVRFAVLDLVSLSKKAYTTLS